MNLFYDITKVKSLESYTDDLYGFEVYVVKGTDGCGRPVEVTTYVNGDLDAQVSDLMKYSANSRSNAKVAYSDGSISSFKHVENAKRAAMKYVNGGTWDFATC